MLDTIIILKELGCKKNIIDKFNDIQQKKVINLNPYNDNNTNSYIDEEQKDKTFKLPNFLKEFEDVMDFYIINTESLYETLLALFDDEYYNEPDEVSIKASDFFRLKLLTDLDENYSNIKNRKNLRLMLDNKITLSDDIFYYLRDYFNVNFYLIKEKDKTIKKYTIGSNNNIFILSTNNKYYPIIGKNNNINVRLFNQDNFDINKIVILKNSIEFTEFKSSQINFKNMSLLEIQEKALDLKINIMKPNKKGDKEIKKTKNELINEIELIN
jgi:hypothetical protein